MEPEAKARSVIRSGHSLRTYEKVVSEVDGVIIVVRDGAREIWVRDTTARRMELYMLEQ